MTAEEARALWQAFPLIEPTALLGRGRAFVLAPHPDDESLGCGGLIAALAASGQPPRVAILTDGAASHPGSRLYPPERLRAVRAAEACAAGAALGLARDDLLLLGLPDGGGPLRGAGFEAALTALAAFGAGSTTVLATWQGDPHGDHVAADAIARALAARLGAAHLAYPVWGWTLPPAAQVPPLAQGWRVDIAAALPAKRRAIAAHRSQSGTLITDDPAGFALPAALLAIFDRPYEVLLQV